MSDNTWEKLAVEANYRPQEIARLCKVSLRTVQRHFTRDFGKTISEWLRTIRLHRAYLRIKQGEQVKVVAYDLGFKQLSHFSRAFKQEHGIPPSFLSRSTFKLVERNADASTAPDVNSEEMAANF